MDTFRQARFNGERPINRPYIDDHGTACICLYLSCGFILFELTNNRRSIGTLTQCIRFEIISNRSKRKTQFAIIWNSWHMPVGFTPTGALQVLVEFTRPILRKKKLCLAILFYIQLRKASSIPKTNFDQFLLSAGTESKVIMGREFTFHVIFLSSNAVLQRISPLKGIIVY